MERKVTRQVTRIEKTIIKLTDNDITEILLRHFDLNKNSEVDYDVGESYLRGCTIEDLESVTETEDDNA
jgi:hypothetical protein